MVHTTTPYTCMHHHESATKSDKSKRLSLLDRDQGLLDFNLRVLSWAEREDVPLLERLRFLCIVSSNLDEFFEVRAELHLSAAKAHDTSAHTAKRALSGWPGFCTIRCSANTASTTTSCCQP